IFLDEPTSGLDPIGRRMVRDILRAQRARGATVFLNSHLLGEIEITCDRVVFIREGQVVETRNLRLAGDGEVVVLVKARNISPEAEAGLSRWCTGVAHQEGELALTLRSRDASADIVRHLVTSGADVLEVSPQREPLEELFVRIMGADRGL